MNDTVFRAESLGKAFGARQVLKSASLWVRTGSITAILGRNGCGKSTLLKASVGLIAPDYGAVHFAGRVYDRPMLHRLAHDGLYVMPDRRGLAVTLTIRQHLEAIQWHFSTRRMEEAIVRFQLEEMLNARPTRLSRGEQQRAELAIAWSRGPRVLFADEPFAEVSPVWAEKVVRTFRSLAGEGCAVVVTGHEVETLLSMADDVIWMTAGTTHGLGSAASAQKHHQFRREYLGTI